MLKIKKDLYVGFFIIFLFGYFLTSINSQPISIYFEGVRFNSAETVNYIDLIRSMGPIVCFIILVFGLFKLKYQKKLIVNKVYYIFLLYFLSQVLSILNFQEINFSKFYNTSINDFYWIIAGSCSIFFFIIFDNFKKEISHKCFYLFLFIIFCVGAVFIFKLIKTIYWDSLENLNLFRNYFYGHAIVGPQARFINAPVPGSGGLARIVAVFFSLSLTFYFYCKPRNLSFANNSFFKFINLIVMIICIAFILHLQSRIMIIFLVVTALFVLLNFDNLSYIKKFITISLIFFVPYLLHTIEPNIRFNYTEKIHEKKFFEFKKNEMRLVLKKILTKNYIYSLQEKKIVLNTNINLNQKITNNYFFGKKIKNLDGKEIVGAAPETPDIKHGRNVIDSSGRIYLWNKSYEMLKKNYFILGYGPQADRKYLNQNVSNLYVYAYLAGGLLGIICIVTIMISHIFLLYKVIFSLRLFKKNNESISKFSIFLIILIYTRSLTENTFGVHSIDMILLLFANHFLMSYVKKNDNKHHVF